MRRRSEEATEFAGSWGGCVKMWWWSLVLAAAMGWAALAIPHESVSGPPALFWTATTVLAGLLTALAAVDASAMVVPDLLSLPFIGVGLLFVWGWPGVSVADHALAAAVGGGAFWALNAIFRAVRGADGLGGGDALVLAGGGAWLGLDALPGVVLLAALSTLVGSATRSLVGLVVIGRPNNALAQGSVCGGAVPFVPGLAFGIWMGWVHGPLLGPLLLTG